MSHIHTIITIDPMQGLIQDFERGAGSTQNTTELENSTGMTQTRSVFPSIAQKLILNRTQNVHDVLINIQRCHNAQLAPAEGDHLSALIIIMVCSSAAQCLTSVCSESFKVPSVRQIMTDLAETARSNCM